MGWSNDSMMGPLYVDSTRAIMKKREALASEAIFDAELGARRERTLVRDETTKRRSARKARANFATWRPSS